MKNPCFFLMQTAKEIKGNIYKWSIHIYEQVCSSLFAFFSINQYRSLKYSLFEIDV